MLTVKLRFGTGLLRAQCGNPVRATTPTRNPVMANARNCSVGSPRNDGASNEPQLKIYDILRMFSNRPIIEVCKIKNKP